jgi:uncharacterized membrane protein
MNTAPAPLPEAPAAAAPAVANEDKTVAIVSYLTLIGFIIAIIIHNNKKTALGAYHLRQAMGLVLGNVVFSMLMVIPFLGWIVGVVGLIFLFVLWVIGLVSAINGQKKPVPLLGPLFQEWFGTIFD